MYLRLIQQCFGKVAITKEKIAVVKVFEDCSFEEMQHVQGLQFESKNCYTNFNINVKLTTAGDWELPAL